MTLTKIIESFSGFIKLTLKYLYKLINYIKKIKTQIKTQIKKQIKTNKK